MSSVAMQLPAVINPKSGGRPGRRLAELRARLATHGLELAPLHLGAGWEAGLEAHLHAAPRRAVLSLGGDGTHLSVINELMRLSAAGVAVPPLLPAAFGTGNDLAKSLGFAPGRRHATQLVGALLTRRTRALDLGRWHERYFADAVSVGLDASVLVRRDRLAMRLPLGGGHGYVAYALAGMQALAYDHAFHCQVCVDGRPYYAGPAVNVLVNNAPVYAGVLEPTPGASAFDGRLDVAVSVGRVPFLARTVSCWRYLPGRRQSSAGISGAAFQLQFDRSLPLQVDGECVADTDRVEIGIEPKAIMVIVPADTE